MSQESRAFLRHILDGDRPAAYRMLQERFHSRGPVSTYEDVICPAMRELGDMWARDEVSVAEEHLATATADAAMAGLYSDFDWPVSRTARVFIACPQGERHSLGARMLADLLAFDGWDESYFGADVPIRTLAKKAAQLNPRAAALSVTLKSHLESAREAAEAIRKASPETKILVGGRAVIGMSPEQVSASTGADMAAGSASEAVRLMRDWR